MEPNRDSLVDRLAGALEVGPRLRDRDEELDWVLQSIGEGVIVSDERGKIILSNPFGRELSVLAAPAETQDPVFGVFLLDGRTPLSPDAYPLACAIRGVATDDLDVIVRNARYPEGITVSIVGRPVRDASGRVRGGVVAARDVTLVKRAERALADETAKLVRLNEELRIARAMAERESRFKSKFLANMSHELRTPLNAVIGFSELLMKEAFGPLNGKQKDYVANVLTSGRHLLHIVNDVLDLSKIEAGRMTLSREWVSLSLVVDSVHRTIAGLATQKTIEFGVELADGLPEVYIDPVRIKQVLYNLLSNAIKFTPSGGSVTLRVRGVDDRVEIAVEDTGIGLRAEDISRLFQEFEQIDLPTRERPEGTGLGLALTKRLVDLHGGTVSVESAPDVGSTFTVRLPSATAPAAPQTDFVALGPREPVPIQENRVLVVESDPHAVEVTTHKLRGAGLSVMVANTAEEAVRMATQLQPRAITLSLPVSGIDARDVLERLKSNPATARIPVVVISLQADGGDAIALGAADYLLRPITRESLVRALERAGVPIEGVTGQRVLVAGTAPDCDELAASLRDAGCKVDRSPTVSIEAAVRDGGVDAVLVDWATVGRDLALEAVFRDLANRSIPVVTLLGSSEAEGTPRVSTPPSARTEAIAGERLARVIHDAIDIASADALWDTATGLPSPQALRAFLRTSVQQAEREFKRIAVLTCRVAFPRHAGASPWPERLRRAFRNGDFVARAGESRIALVTLGATDEAANAIAARLPTVLRDRLRVEAGGVEVAWFPTDGRTAEALLEHAQQDKR